MKKLKVISFIMAVCLLFLFAGCGEDSGTAQNNSSGGITGNWYNGSGRCLEIREDGTYKLEDDYGLGHWKTLSDGSYEFSDFYGDLQGFETGTDGTGEYVRLNSEYFYRSSESDGAVQPENTNLQVTKAYDFSEGYAWVEFTRDGVECYGLIDTQGKIIYEDVYNNQKQYEFYPMSGSMCYMSCGDVYSLLNSKGEKIMSSENGDFDEVLAAGDGRALVYKNNSGVKETEYIYGVIDSSGNWVQPLSDWDIYLDVMFYAGDGMFVYRDDYKYSNFDRYLIYNSITDVFYDISGLNSDDCTFNGDFKDKLALFSNGTAFFRQKYNDTDVSFKQLNKTELADPDSVDAIIKGEALALSTDGTCVEVPYFESQSDGKLLIYNNEENESYYQIYDYVNNTTKKVTEYSASVIYSIKFTGNYGLTLIKGADGKIYCTVLDTSGNEKFDPIQCSYSQVNYTDGKIVIDNSSYSIYDDNGNLLAEKLDYKSINAFSNDIAVATDDEKNTFYINSKGEKILTYLSE